MKLVADIGATNTRVKVGDFYTEFKTKDFFEKFKEIEKSHSFDKIVFGLARTIKSDSITINKNVTIKKSDFKKYDPIFINDVQAQAYGLKKLKKSEFIKLNDAKGFGETKAIVTVGTGLGASYYNEAAFPSALSSLFKDKNIYQDYLSGKGLTKIYYEFYNKKVKPEVAIKDKKTRIKFFSLLGEVCYIYSMCVLPFAGLYLSGGILNKNVDLFEKEAFFSKFNKRTHYKDIPVFLVKPQDLGVRGCEVL
ncbi:MAG: glucokinase [Candidatus Woesearchaeota archaeon]